MRAWSYFGIVLAVGSLLAGSAAEDRAIVRQVAVQGVGKAIAIEIHTVGAAASPNSQVLRGPDRIIVDFPGALPGSELHSLKVNRGALKGIRSGLFFEDPPITRIVLDLREPQPYQIMPIADGVIVRLGVVSEAVNVVPVPAPAASKVDPGHLTVIPKISTQPSIGVLATPPTPETATPPPPPQPPPPPKPVVSVTFENGLLRIHTEGGTLAEVLFEVQRHTNAEIAIPAGAEQEQVVADLGPAPAHDVLASLLNGSRYNFIFVDGEEGHRLEKVILTRRPPTF